MDKKRNLPKLDVNVTNNCNLRCRHCCFQSGERDLGEMSYEKIEEMLREFVKLGGQRIDITGGEPLRRKDLNAILTLAIPVLGLRTELVTNSLLAHDSRLVSFKNFGLNEIAVSLDGSTAERHAVTRGTNQKQFDRVLYKIKKSAELGIKTKVNTVVFAHNLSDLENITRLAISLGAREHGFYFFSPIGRGNGNGLDVASPLDWLEIIRTRLVKHSGQIKISLEVPLLETEIASRIETRCYLEDPWHLQILPDGNVYPCAIMAAYGKSLGNLHEKTLSEIWRSERLWDGGYYNEHVLPLFKKQGSCVEYPAFEDLLKSEKYRPVCLCRKFKPEEVAR